MTFGNPGAAVIESSDGAGGQTVSRFRRAITILIGVASVLGAVATWHLTTVSGKAGGADARAIESTINQERDRSNARVVAREDVAAFARVRGYSTAITSLQRLADQAVASGNAQAAADLRSTAQSLQQLEQELITRFPDVGPGSIFVSKDGSRFDAARLRAAIEANSQTIINGGQGDPRPDLAVAEATNGHDHARELGLVVLGFAIAIFLLALADKLRRDFAPVLAVGGVVALAAAAIAALVLW